MESTTEKILVGILLVALGWLLGQGGEIIREWRTRRRLRRELLEELGFLSQTIPGLIDAYRKSFQLAVHGIIDSRITLKLEHPIYQNFYKDVCSKLNRDQRFSYQTIHSSVDMYNSLLEKQMEVDSLELNGLRSDAVTRWGSTVDTQYGNLRLLLFRIDYHLEYLKDESGEISDESEAAYDEYVAEVDRDRAKLIEETKHLNPKDI